MAEKVETAARVADLKKRESELAESRNALKTQIIGLVEGHITELREIGFDYALAENSASNGAGKSDRKCGNCGGNGHTKATCPQQTKK